MKIKTATDAALNQCLIDVEEVTGVRPTEILRKNRSHENVCLAQLLLYADRRCYGENSRLRDKRNRNPIRPTNLREETEGTGQAAEAKGIPAVKRMWSQYYLEYLAFNSGEILESEELMQSAAAYADAMTEINYEPIKDEDENTDTDKG